MEQWHLRENGIEGVRYGGSAGTRAAMLRFGVAKKAGSARLQLLFQRLVTNCTRCPYHPENCGGLQGMANLHDFGLPHNGHDDGASPGPRPPDLVGGWPYDPSVPGVPRLKVPRVGADHEAPVVAIVRGPLARLLSAFLDKGIVYQENAGVYSALPSCFGHAATARFKLAGGKKGARAATGTRRAQLAQAFRQAVKGLHGTLLRLARAHGAGGADAQVLAQDGWPFVNTPRCVHTLPPFAAAAAA